MHLVTLSPRKNVFAYLRSSLFFIFGCQNALEFYFLLLFIVLLSAAYPDYPSELHVYTTACYLYRHLT